MQPVLRTAEDAPISCYAPWSSDCERASRARLYKSRDLAGARAARAEGWAQCIWKTTEDLAADMVWRRASERELKAAADAVVRMIQAATRLEEGAHA